MYGIYLPVESFQWNAWIFDVREDDESSKKLRTHIQFCCRGGTGSFSITFATESEKTDRKVGNFLRNSNELFGNWKGLTPKKKESVKGS